MGCHGEKFKATEELLAKAHTRDSTRSLRKLTTVVEGRRRINSARGGQRRHRAWILLIDGGDGVEPLFLQAKEAQLSVLAGYCGRSQYNNQGERIVAGQHLMQAESAIFLGWTRAPGPDGVDRDFYVRQLKDWKFSAPIDQMRPPA